VVSPVVEGGFVDYAVVAAAYRDLEAAWGRLALIDRMAALLGETPDDELATVCYLCQGQIAPEHAGIDLGLASKLAMRSVGVATGKDAEAVTAAFREAGDLGEAAEAVLPDRKPSLTVGEVVETLHEIARSEGIGSQGRKIELLAGLLARATPVEARYLLRLVTGSLRLGIGTPTILEALAVVHAGGRKDRPVLWRERGRRLEVGVHRLVATPADLARRTDGERLVGRRVDDAHRGRCLVPPGDRSTVEPPAPLHRSGGRGSGGA
jgi:DNA ligase-1